MVYRRTAAVAALSTVLFLLLTLPGATGDPDGRYTPPGLDAATAPQAGPAVVRRINAPYFPGDIRFSETAVAWFGQVTDGSNAGDVRVGYNGDRLFVRCGAFDRWLWYEKSPSPSTLTDWDAFTLYLDLDGNSGGLDASSHRFDAQLVWWEERTNHQAAYRGDGGTWAAAGTPFTTSSFWRGYDSPNNNSDNDRGWALTFSIPFASLGLSGPPAQGTVWGMAIAMHDRDSAAGPPLPVQWWPETAAPTQPATWGQLHFGLPAYEPLPAVPGDTVMVRDRVDGATVTDADVGGSTNCGASTGPDYFPTWGSLNYDGKTVLNVQNLGDIGDWPCFSRIYLTFPLDVLPSDKVILSATLTMYQFGNAGAGYDPGPQPSLIQVFTVDRDWDEATINWNNAPMAVENVAAAWADVFPELPGEPREWDLSRAVAQAYAAGAPLRLALYESDWAYHSGKYFRSSEMNEYEAYMRPTLRITWGDPVAKVRKSAQPTSGAQGDPIAYTLRFLGTGRTLALTDTLPSGISAPAAITVEGTPDQPVYSASRLTWSGAPALGQQVTIRYTVSIEVATPQALRNLVELAEATIGTSTDQALVIANPHRAFLPLVARRR